ncbi:TIGR01777 family oxidoreductase [Opitutaceae bacterium]
MTSHRLTRRVRIARPAAEVFAWHERPGAFERLQPPWEQVQVIRRSGGIRDGATVSVRTKAGPVWLRWDVRHHDYVAGVQFRDHQQRGPFRQWEHLHRIEPDGPDACILVDDITYALPGGAVGRLAEAGVRRRLERMFDYRHAVTKADLETTNGTSNGRSLRILVSGASGLVGRVLVPLLTTQGHSVVRLVRRASTGPDEARWDPMRGTLDLTGVGRIDAVVNLAGAGIADGRWSVPRRREILESRVNGTRTLVAALARLPERPDVLINASAVGFYGDRGDEVLTESAAGGRGFLAEVCQAWETEMAAAEVIGLRTVALRTGMVLTPAGGALARMLPLFHGGLGGPLGSGRQWTGWITPDDLCGMILAAIADARWRGPVNAVAPEVMRQREFASTLGRVLRRPVFLPTPAWALTLGFGEMARELLLSSARVEPAKARALGYTYRHGALSAALTHMLGRRGSR